MLRTLLVSIICISIPIVSSSKNLGVHGPTFAIAEQNLMEVIQAKLQHLQKNGKIASINSQIVEHVKHSALNPTPTHLPTVTEYKARLFDPTYLVKKDLTDHQGQIIAKAGTKINPLDHFNWGTPLILIDGEDADQIAWAKAADSKSKLVLIKGRPIEFKQLKNRRIYFDQGGRIVKHFGIIKVLTKISQQGKQLLIEEIPPIAEGINS